MTCKTCGKVHRDTWECSCGKHTGIVRLSDVRRHYGDEYHGVWMCEKGGKRLEGYKVAAPGAPTKKAGSIPAR